MLRIANWDKWQSFRSDRGAPPWIKVHRNLMTNPAWAMLTDAEKGQIISMWIVAADKGGEIPTCPRILMKVCQLDEQPNINRFIELGFIESDGCHDDAKMTPSGSHDDPPDKIRGEEIREEKSMSGKHDDAKKILLYLNQVTGKSFKPVTSNLSKISARLKEGSTIEEMMKVIDRKTAEWKGNKTFDQYLRPKTLFGTANFNNYVGDLDSPLPQAKQEKPEWAKMPFSDLGLEPFAKQHGFPKANPGESSLAYRRRLQAQVNKRLERG